jgi:hypothetical protein
MGDTKMKMAIVAVLLLPFAYPYGALSWNLYALSYQEAVWMCGTGNLQACDVMYAYDEMARSGVAGISPADLTGDMSVGWLNSDAGATPAIPK